MDTPTAAQIDHFVDVALHEWEVVGELDKLDPVFVECFLTDWPVVEDRLARLARWESFMSPAQHEKYAEVLRLEGAYRPRVESQL
jgi:hypothetical protein